MILQIDAAQIEWRVAAWLSNDETALQEINDGVDFHSQNQKVFGLPSRLIAKIYLFRTIFRGSGYAFSRDPEFSHVSDDPAFWDDINQKFYKKYWGLDKWHNELARLCAERKVIVSPFGREWRIQPKEDGKLPWTVFCNYPVQGTAADILMVARISLANRIGKLSLKSKLISTIHDSIVMDCPSSEIEVVGQQAMLAFNNLPANITKFWGVPVPLTFPGEVKVGPNLRDTVALDKYLQR